MRYESFFDHWYPKRKSWFFDFPIFTFHLFWYPLYYHSKRPWSSWNLIATVVCLFVFPSSKMESRGSFQLVFPRWLQIWHRFFKFLNFKGHFDRKTVFLYHSKLYARTVHGFLCVNQPSLVRKWKLENSFSSYNLKMQVCTKEFIFGPKWSIFGRPEPYMGAWKWQKRCTHQ